MCVCVNASLWACVSENRREKSVAMHFYTSSHWSLHMKHHSRDELKTQSWAIFPVIHFSSKSNESLSVALEVGCIPESSWWCEGERAWTPINCLLSCQIAPLLWWILRSEQSGSSLSFMDESKHYFILQFNLWWSVTLYLFLCNFWLT